MSLHAEKEISRANNELITTPRCFGGAALDTQPKTPGVYGRPRADSALCSSAERCKATRKFTGKFSLSPHSGSLKHKRVPGGAQARSAGRLSVPRNHFESCLTVRRAGLLPRLR